MLVNLLACNIDRRRRMGHVNVANKAAEIRHVHRTVNKFAGESNYSTISDHGSNTNKFEYS